MVARAWRPGSAVLVLAAPAGIVCGGILVRLTHDAVLAVVVAILVGLVAAVMAPWLRRWVPS